MHAPANNDAFKHCRDIAHHHYENFPVASWLLPKKLRNPISAIYAFARTADDLADEGDKEAPERMADLNAYTHMLHIMGQPQAVDPVFIALSDSCTQFNLDTQLLDDLLTAFKQDVTQKRYSRFADVLSYCRYSANPVGRLLLQLVQKDTEENRQYSDRVCTGLQLINFYQDIQQDFVENNRIYLALEEMQQAGLSENDFFSSRHNDDVVKFMHSQVLRADKMLLSGLPLCGIIGGRLGFELRFTVLGAHRVAEKLLGSNEIFSRPRLTLFDWIVTSLRVLSRNRFLGS